MGVYILRSKNQPKVFSFNINVHESEKELRISLRAIFLLIERPLCGRFALDCSLVVTVRYKRKVTFQ